MNNDILAAIPICNQQSNNKISKTTKTTMKMGCNYLINSCLFQQNKLSLPSLMEAFSNNSKLLSTIDKMS